MENIEHEIKRRQFVSEICSMKNAIIQPLANDASSRLYFRVKNDEKTYVLLDDVNKKNKTDVFIKLSTFLIQNGVHAPEVLFQDIDNGLLLLEDLGDGTFGRLLNADNEEFLYNKATQALIKVAKIKEKPSYINKIDIEKVTHDICFFVDDYYPFVAGKKLEASKRAEFVALIDDVVNLGFSVPNTLMLWDYHVDNLMLLNNDQNCGVLDFQDAYWGPITYDIMSLLEDARREISQEVITKMYQYYYENLEGVDEEDFLSSWRFFAMFRHMRVLGRFADLYVSLGKDKYLKHIPHLWNMLEKSLEYPKFAKIKVWVDCNFPKEFRQVPVLSLNK